MLAFLKSDPASDFNFLSDVVGIDYQNYPTPTIGRFSVAYVLLSHSRDDRFIVKTFLNPSLPTDGTVEDPTLYLDSVTNSWVASGWRPRGVRYVRHPLPQPPRPATHPAVGRLSAHPLRKDYPVRGRGEREQYRVVDRTSA